MNVRCSEKATHPFMLFISASCSCILPRRLEFVGDAASQTSAAQPQQPLRPSGGGDIDDAFRRGRRQQLPGNDSNNNNNNLVGVGNHESGEPWFGKARVLSRNGTGGAVEPQKSTAPKNISAWTTHAACALGRANLRLPENPAEQSPRSGIRLLLHY